MYFLIPNRSLTGSNALQATNLLRALRQVRETAALGLLDGLSAPPGVVVAEMEGPKEWALSQRIASLNRFLLDHMVKCGLLRA